MFYVEKFVNDSKIFVRDTKDGVIECYSKSKLFDLIVKYSIEINGVSIPKVYSVDCLCLCNKDSIIAYIVFSNKVIIDFEFVSEVKPFTFQGNFMSWLEDRLLINERTYVKDFFSYLGISSYVDYMYITHFVSLTDTYWVRGYNENIKWSDVSPYINDFNDVIANYSFDGKISSKNLRGSSPDMSLGGSFPKCWRRKNKVIEMVKAGTTFASNCGREPFSEIYVSQLEKYLGVYDYVDYKYIKYKGLDCTSCKLITSEDIGLISARDLVKSKSGSYIDLLSMLSNEDKVKFKEMLCIDILTVNIDRHFGNIGFFINNDTQELIGLSPIFDNNMALVPYYDKEFNGGMEEYVRYYCAKDGSDFIELYNKIRDSHTDMLIRKSLGFRFKKVVDSLKVNDDRLNLFNDIVHYQAKRCLGLL